jgi:hypothetical protein
LPRNGDVPIPDSCSAANRIPIRSPCRRARATAVKC